MAKYRIKTDNGTFEVEVAENSGAAPEPTDPGMSVEGFAKNVGSGVERVVSGVGNMVKGAAKIPSEMLESAGMMGMGLPFGETAIADKYRTIGQGAVDAVKSIPTAVGDLARPRKYYEQPVEQLLTAASVAPFLKLGGAAVSRGAKAAGAVSEAAEGASLPAKIYAKATRIGVGLPEETTLARLKNPAAVKTAFSHPEVAEQVVESVKNFDTKIGNLTEKAWEKLSTSPYLDDGAVPRETLVDMAKSARKGLGAAHTPELKAAKRALKDIETSYSKKLKNTVSESQIKDRIQELDANIDWDNTAVSKTNEGLVSLRRKLDGMLKGKNEDYRKAMEPIDEAITVRDKLKNTFGIKKDRKTGYFAGDQTVGKVKRGLREDKLETQGVIKRFEKESGEDLTTRMKNANARADFEGDAIRPGAYNRAGVYAGAGATIGEVFGQSVGLPPVIGGAVGGTLGTIAGAISEIYGRNVAGRITDALSGAKISPQTIRYVRALEKAAKQGPRNVAVVHSILMKDDPEYAKMMGQTGASKTRQLTKQ